MVIWFLLPLNLFAAPPSAVGQRVVSNATVNVRTNPAGTGIGQQPAGREGLVIDGPQYASLGGTPYTWWRIDFDSGLDGWVAHVGIDVLAGPPAAPGHLEGQAYSNRVELGWADNSSNETGFKIERRTGNGSYTQIGTRGSNSGGDAFYTDSDISPRTIYSYRVRAYNANGDSGYSPVVTLTTPGGRPGQFSLSHETPVWDTSIPGPSVRLNWTSSSDRGAYAVYRNGQVYRAGIDGNTFLNNTGLSGGATYTYFIRASNADGETDSNTITVTMPQPPPSPPAAPGHLEGQAYSNRVELGWEDNSLNETGFKIERRIGNGGFTQIATSPANPDGDAFYTDTTTAPRTTYSYRVRAYNALGDSGYSPVVTLTTPGGPPGAFTLSHEPPVWDASIPGPSVWLNWTASSDRGGYAVHRNGEVYRAGLDGTTFLNNANLTGGATYTYFIRASNADGITDSNTVSVTMPSVPGGGGPTLTRITPESLTGSASPQTITLTGTNFVSGSQVQVAFASNGYTFVNTYTAATFVSATTLTVPITTGAAADTWRVRVWNPGGATSNTVNLPVSVTGGAPAAPSTLVVLLAQGGFASMAWNDDSSNETGFRIDRKTGGGDWVHIATTGVNVAAYQDHAVAAGNIYTYRVRAQNASGLSGPTQDVTVDYPASGPLTVLVTGPADSTSWAAGDTQPVTWLTTGLKQQISYFTVSYSLNGGASFTGILPNPSASANTLNWRIPSDLSSTQARIRVTAHTSAGAAITSGTSPVFTIRAPAAGPVAVPDVNNSGPPAGVPITFTGRDSKASAGRTITGYQWAFGDGESASGATVSHTYTRVGSYSARLTVTDSAGEKGSDTIVIRVSGKSLGSEAQSGFFADPVNLATGNFILSADDIELPGMGFPLKFSRFYNSKDTDGDALPLGHHWTHSHNVSLTEAADGVITIRFGDGRRETHRPEDAGGYTAEPGTHDRLERTGPGLFSLHGRDQMEHRFSSGRLTSISDRNGNTQLLEYNAGGQLVKITDTSGRFLTFSYGPDGRMKSLTDPLNRTFQYGYGPAGDLTTVTNPRNGVTRYTYDALHQILTAADPNGNVFVTNEYDAEQRVVHAQRDALGNLSRFAYDFPSGVTTVTDPFNNVTTHRHDDRLRLTAKTNELGQTESYEYDGDNNRTAVISRNGHATQYSYDAAGNVTSKTDPLGGRTIIQYNSRNDPVFRTDAISHAEQTAASAPSGYGTAFEYDGKGNLTRTTDAAGKATVMTHNTAGKVLTLTDRRNNKTTHEYDAVGNRVRTTDALAGVTSATFDAAGRMLTSTDQNLRVTRFTYDASDHVLTVRDPLDQTTVSEYDANGNRTLVRDPMNGVTRFAYDVKDRLVRITDAAGGIVRHEYDAYDRKTKTIDARGHASTVEYDAAGRLTASVDATGRRTAYTYDANGNRLAVIDPMGKASRSTYDALDRLLTSADALGNTTTHEYDRLGRKISQQDALGRVTRSEYDRLGHLVKVTDAAGGTVTYTYDEEGNRTSVTNPRGKITRIQYDALNRLTRREEPAGGTEQTVHDAAGNRVRRIDARNQTVEYVYDAANRLARINYPTGAPVVFTLDANGNRTRMSDSTGESRYVFDALNRMTSHTGPFGHTVGYEYDAASNRAAIIHPGNRRVEYTYDNAGRMLSVKDWGNRVTTYQYDAAGRLSVTQNPNGTAAAQTYDDAGRLATLRNTRAGGAVISSYVYTMDAVGNHTQVDQEEPVEPSPNPGAFSYRYDDEDRILEMEGIPQQNDANGNLTGSGADLQLFYDFENRLVRQKTPDSEWTWRYDGAGRRVEMNRGGGAERFVLDVNTPLTQVIGIAGEAGDIFESYVYGLGLVSRIDQAGNASYYHYDSRGSTIAITGAGGAQEEGFAYDPFGRLIGRSPAEAIDNFTFLGRHGVMNDYNGFYFVRARHYSSRRGRFLSKDPFLGLDDGSQTINRYIYALNNPIKSIDINGFFAWDTFGLGALQLVSGYSQVIGGAGLSGIVAAQEFSRTGNPLALASGFMNMLDEVNEGSKNVAAGMQNTLINSFTERGFATSDEEKGIMDGFWDDHPNLKRIEDLRQTVNFVKDLKDLTTLSLPYEAYGNLMTSKWPQGIDNLRTILSLPDDFQNALRVTNGLILDSHSTPNNFIVPTPPDADAPAKNKSKK